MAETSPVQPGSDDDRTLCKLAVRHDMLTVEQVRSAFRFKAREKRRGRELGIEEILQERGWISPKQLSVLRKACYLLKQRGLERSLAQAVIELGLVNQSLLDEALREQTSTYKKSGRFLPLGEILVERRALSRHDLLRLTAGMGQPDPGAGGAPSVGQIQSEGRAEQVPASPTDSGGSDSEATGGEDRLGRLVFRDPVFDLIVSHDAMQAFLRLKNPTSKDITVDDLTLLFESKGISFGVVEEDLLRRGLKQQRGKSVVFRIAQGLEPKPGRDAEVRFYVPFSRGEGPLPGDSSSLEDYGTIPQVQQGDVLAEKTPRTPGTDGMDVYGRSIPVDQGKDLPLLCGTGVSLSEDGLRAVAEVTGRVMFSAYGKMAVLEELVIPGDVSFETGNVESLGIVFVHGVVQDGFKVRCGSLVCNEIGRAEIDAEGDIMVFGGVLGARIHCLGDLACVHVHASRVEALGDIVAEKGIVDSKVKTSGRCVVKHGMIAASLVYAKRGIEAAQIGHERSRSCTLGMGFDPLLETEVERLKGVIVGKESKAAKQRGALKEMVDQLQRAELRTGELAQVQDRAMRERRTTASMLEDVTMRQDKRLQQEIEDSLAEIDRSIMEAERELGELLDMQDQLKPMIRAHKAQVSEVEKEVALVGEEIATVTTWGQSAPDTATVRVRGKLFGGTSVRGTCTTVTIGDTLSGILIREIVGKTGTGECGGPGVSRMSMTKLR